MPDYPGTYYLVHGRHWNTRPDGMINHCLSSMVVVLIISTCLSAQIPTSSGLKKEPPAIELDIRLLLSSPEVLPDRLTDDIWNLTPRSGRRFVQLPIMVMSQPEPIELAAPSIDVRSGKFMCWRLPLESEKDSVQLTAAIPIPRIARDLVILPDSKVRWPLERTIPGCELKTGDALYLLKLRPDRMQEMVPQRPERLARKAGETTRAFSARQIESQNQYRENLDTYKALREQVRNLPDEFEIPQPSVLWAVFDANEAIDELELTGPPPMPWVIDINLLKTLRDMANSRTTARKKQLTEDDYETIQEISILLDDQHPLSYQILAMVVTANHMAALARPDDPLHKLLKALIDSGNATVRQHVIFAAAKVIPPTETTAALLKYAQPYMDAHTKLLGLRSLFHSDLSSPTQLSEIIATVNYELGQLDGPDAGRIIHELIGGVSDDPQAVELLCSSINFDTLPEERFDQAATYIIASSTDQPLSGYWLDKKLLQSADPRVVLRTLQLIAESRMGPELIKRLAVWTIDHVSARQIADQHHSTRPITPDSESMPDADTDIRDDRMAQPNIFSLNIIAQLTGSNATRYIPLDSVEHGLIPLLTTDQEPIQLLAWQVLPMFRIATGTPSMVFDKSQVTTTNGQENDICKLIMDAASARPTLPPQVISFLDHHVDSSQATAALIDIAVREESYLGDRAARLLIGSERELAKPLESLTVDQRQQLANRIYHVQHLNPPLATGLLRQTGARNNVVNWFAGELAAGTLPEPKDWAQAYRNDEGQLLSLTGDQDKVLATGALAALLAMSGGDSLDASTLIDRFHHNQPVASKNIAKQVWTEIKREIRTAALSPAAGTYTFIITVRGKITSGLTLPGGKTTAGSDERQQVIIPLGIIDLVADGKNIYIAGQTFSITVADEQDAIRINQLSELKNFNNETLNQLPLESITRPLDLIQGDDGSWQGHSVFPGTTPSELEISLQPL